LSGCKESEGPGIDDSCLLRKSSFEPPASQPSLSNRPRPSSLPTTSNNPRLPPHLPHFPTVYPPSRDSPTVSPSSKGMQADCIPSSSRLPVHDIWDRPPSEWTFSMHHPVSNCRSEAFLVESMAQPTSIAAIPVVAPSPPHYPTSSDSQKLMPPARWEKAPGVLTDGKRTVYSSALPEVQRVLQVARQTLAPPSLSSEVIFTLAALSVFYHPTDPAHWTFWSDDKKNHTADIVNRIACESSSHPLALEQLP
jgi:hypothetical protein